MSDAATADPDKPCPHEDFEARVEVNRLLASEGDTEPNAFAADITVSCVACGERFRWIGVPAGLNGGHPTCSVDEFTLHAPLRPASSDPDFGLGIPGFSIAIRTGNDA
jgi:hypothetical protein